MIKTLTTTKTAPRVREYPGTMTERIRFDMKNHTSKTLLAALSIAGLTLVGCGSSEAEEAPEQTVEQPHTEETEPVTQDEEDLTPEQEARRDAMLNDSDTAGHGTWKVHAMSGTELEFQLPADESHESVAELDALREELGIEPVTYITVEIDNRHGEAPAEIGTINAYDVDGTEYEFKSLPYALPEWAPEYGGEDDTEYREASDQLNALEDEHHANVQPAGVDSTVLIYPDDDLPEEFTRVATFPYGTSIADDAYQVD